MSLIRKLLLCSKFSTAGGGQTRRDRETDTENKQHHGGTDGRKEAADGKSKKEMAAEEEGEGEEGEGEGECAVCQDVVHEPCTLPCGNRHVFCLACLRGLLTHSPHRHHFLCPLCRKRVRIPLGGVAAFRNNKTLGQKLRARLPDLRPSAPRRRRRGGPGRRGGRRSRSELRSTEYVTVSFPVLGYPDELELDLLSTLYAHRPGQSAERERLVEALLGEIAHMPVLPSDPSSSSSRDRSASWLSDDDSEEEEEEEDDEENGRTRSAAGRRSGVSSAEGSRAVPVEELDMSVVLQIIADMEENERCREATRRGDPPGTTAGCPPSRAGSGTPQTSDTGAESPRSEHVTSAQGSDTGDVTILRTSETGEMVAPHGEDSRSTSSQAWHFSNSVSRAGNTLPNRSDTVNTESPRQDMDPAASTRSENDGAVPERPESSSTMSPTSEVDDTKPDRPCATFQTSETLLPSPQRSEVPQVRSERSARRRTSPPDPSWCSAAQRNCDSGRGESSRTGRTQSLRSQGSSAEESTARSSSSGRSPAKAAACDGPQGHRPFRGDADVAQKENYPHVNDFRFAPRPRMGSFRLAIAAGQRTRAPCETESPPLLASPQLPGEASSAQCAPRNHVTSSHGVQEPPAGQTKRGIEHCPSRTQRPHRQTANPDRLPAAEQRSEEQPGVMTMGARQVNEELTAVVDGADTVRSQEQLETRTPRSTPQNSATRDSYEGHQHPELRRPDLRCRYAKKTRSLVEDSPASAQSDASRPTSEAAQPEPHHHAPQTGHGRKPGHGTQQGPASPPTDGLEPKQRRLQERSSRPKRVTPPADGAPEKPDPQPASPESQEDAGPGSRLPAAERDAEDSEEWTRRIRGLQRRVISQTQGRLAGRDGHRAAGSSTPAGGRRPRHGPTSTPLPADDRALLSDRHGEGVDVFHV